MAAGTVMPSGYGQRLNPGELGNLPEMPEIAIEAIRV